VAAFPLLFMWKTPPLLVVAFCTIGGADIRAVWTVSVLHRGSVPRPRRRVNGVANNQKWCNNELENGSSRKLQTISGRK
jgi:hypothetical protein